MVLEGEEGPTDGFQCVGLDDRPFLYRFHFLICLEEEGQFRAATDSSVESGDFKDLELVTIGELLLGWRENYAILQGVDQAFQLCTDFGG